MKNISIPSSVLPFPVKYLRLIAGGRNRFWRYCHRFLPCRRRRGKRAGYRAAPFANVGYPVAALGAGGRFAETAPHRSQAGKIADHDAVYSRLLSGRTYSGNDCGRRLCQQKRRPAYFSVMYSGFPGGVSDSAPPGTGGRTALHHAETGFFHCGRNGLYECRLFLPEIQATLSYEPE